MEKEQKDVITTQMKMESAQIQRLTINLWLIFSHLVFPRIPIYSRTRRRPYALFGFFLLQYKPIGSSKCSHFLHSRILSTWRSWQKWYILQTFDRIRQSRKLSKFIWGIFWLIFWLFYDGLSRIYFSLKSRNQADLYSEFK